MPALARSRIRTIGLIISVVVALLAMLFSYRSQAAPTSTLTLSAASVPQESSVTLSGQGFAPGEMISLWQTFPDYTVTAIPAQTADATGAFSLDLYVGKDLPLGWHIFTAHGASSEREEYIELNLTVAEGPQPSAEARLSAEPRVDRQGAVVALRGTGFGAAELVALWGRYPDGGSFELSQVTSDSSGAFEVLLAFGGNPTGPYVFSAQGLSSGHYTFGEMLLEVGDLNGPTQPAALTVQPSAGDQLRSVMLEGSGFDAGEQVTIWTTLPNNATAPLGQATSDDAGHFVADIFLDETVPVGQHVFSARGNSSGRLATTPYFLDAGGDLPQP